jgi:hypothetical protein
MSEYEQSTRMKSDKGWCVVVNGFVRAIFPFGPKAEADCAVFQAALDSLAADVVPFHQSDTESEEDSMDKREKHDTDDAGRHRPDCWCR